jgi:hypothetical protein
MAAPLKPGLISCSRHSRKRWTGGTAGQSARSLDAKEVEQRMPTEETPMTGQKYWELDQLVTMAFLRRVAEIVEKSLGALAS